MSNTRNLAGNNLIVDSVETTDGSSQDLLSMRLAIQQARSVNASGLSKSQNKEVYDSIEELNDSVDATIATLAKIGAIKTSGFNGKIDVFAYNPTKPYDASYSSDYYVSMGYVIRDGVILPVAMPTKYKTFTPATKEGVWAICIYKENIADEVYLPIIACPYANGTAMKWYAIDSQGTTYDWSSTDVALKSLLVIGSFDYTALDGVYNLFVIQGGQSPQNFLNYQFLDIMGKAVDGGRTDFSNWATAMKVDQIFERLAVLELFVNNLYARNLNVGTYGTGFSFRALTDDNTSQHNKVFDVSYNGTSLFRVDISTGKIYFGSGFWYDPSDSAIHSTSNNIVIASNGTMSAQNATISGNLTATTFAFGNVTMKWGYFHIPKNESFPYISILRIDLAETYGVSWGDMVTVQYAGLDEEPLAYNSFSLILNDTARTVSETSTLVDTNGINITYCRGANNITLGLQVSATKDTEVFIQAFHQN